MSHLERERGAKALKPFHGTNKKLTNTTVSKKKQLSEE